MKGDEDVLLPGVPAGVVAGGARGVGMMLVGGRGFSTEAMDDVLEEAESVDIVSTLLIVDERLGIMGKPLNEGRSHDMDMAFLGVGRVLGSDDTTEGGTGGRSL